MISKLNVPNYEFNLKNMIENLAKYFDVFTKQEKIHSNNYLDMCRSIYISYLDVGMLSFDLSKKKRYQLVQSGEQAVHDYFARPTLEDDFPDLYPAFKIIENEISNINDFKENLLKLSKNVITILFVHNDDFEIDLFRIVATSSFENIKIKGLLKAMKKLITTTKKLCAFVRDEISICNVIKEEFKLIMDFLKNRYINIWDNDASLTLINEKIE